MTTTEFTFVGPPTYVTALTQALEAQRCLAACVPLAETRDLQTVQSHNKDINGLRATVARSIAHIRTWGTLHTDYRRPLSTCATAFRTIRALHFFRLSSK